MAQLVAVFKESLWFSSDHKSAIIDSWSFKAFNTVSSSIFVLCSIIVSSRQFFGEPLRCDAGEVSSKYKRTTSGAVAVLVSVVLLTPFHKELLFLLLVILGALD